MGTDRYHDNSFVTSPALHIENELNPSATLPLLEEFFKEQANACFSAYNGGLKSTSRRNFDVLASRFFFSYSSSYELAGDLAEVRG
ncbi:putative 26S proteasome non-ATPase regulatory subunit 3, partial [Drosera capensis]